MEIFALTLYQYETFIVKKKQIIIQQNKNQINKELETTSKSI